MHKGKTETCGGCHNTDEAHEMTKCSKCGQWMCPRCLYLPSLNAPCWCAACRSGARFSVAGTGGSTPADPLWLERVLLVPKGDGDYLERFAAAYPSPGRWAQAVISEAETADAHVSVIVAAAKMLADFHEWGNCAVAAMRHRDAKKFDRLASHYDRLCRFTVYLEIDEPTLRRRKTGNGPAAASPPPLRDGAGVSPVATRATAHHA